MKKLFIIFLCLITLMFSARSEDLKKIKGSVKEIQTGKPVENALVFLHTLDLKTTTMTTTDSTGNFSFKNISGKFVKISVTRMGYDEAEYGPIKLKKKNPHFKFELTPIPYATEEVVVEEKKLSPTLVRNGFYKRKMTATGKFYDQKYLEETNVKTFTQFMRRVPHFKIDSESGIIKRKRLTGINTDGKPLIFIDGIMINLENKNGQETLHTDLRNVINMDDVAGIEIYRSVASVPAQYTRFGSGNGVILIWTK